MNCRPGDLAVIVKSNAGNEGKIVRVLRFIGWVPGWLGDDRWETDRILPGRYVLSGLPADASPYLRDSCLRPIRDPGEGARDETLTWLDVPTKEIA